VGGRGLEEDGLKEGEEGVGGHLKVDDYVIIDCLVWMTFFSEEFLFKCQRLLLGLIIWARFLINSSRVI